MIDIIKVAFLVAVILIILQTVLLPIVRRSRTNVNFFLFSILITVFLIFIIEIKLHHILRSWIHIPNTITYLMYASVITFYLLKFKDTILTYNFLWILFAFSCFGIAVALDLLTDGKILHFPQSDNFENILHLTGVILWFIFFIITFFKLKFNE